jgi:UPF0176 protein
MLAVIYCPDCAKEYEGCCCEECRTVIHLPEDQQKEMRKGKPAGRIFSKGRFPGKLMA